MLFSDLMVKILMMILTSGQIRNCLKNALFGEKYLFFNDLLLHCNCMKNINHKRLRFTSPLFCNSSFLSSNFTIGSSMFCCLCFFGM